MRYELFDHESTAIKPMLPNKPCGSGQRPCILNNSSGSSKQRRRVATRYDKLAANYLAFIQIAPPQALANCSLAG